MPVALLVCHGVLFGVFSFGGGLLVFDDHPGQLYRLWHVVTLGAAPWRWDPGWWMGYPELQFYPPGFAWVGKAIHVICLGRLPLDANYQALVWIVYLAPGVTTYLLLTRLLGSGWLALPGAFIAMTLSAGVSSGVEGGVHIGMIASRLGWALLPLLVLAVAEWVDARRIPLGAAPLLVAGITLMHPAHLPTVLAIVFLAAATGSDIGRRLGEACITLALAAAVTAVWTLPLMFRLAETRALAWGSLTANGPLAHLGREPMLIALVILAALATRLGRSPVEIVVARLPWAMTVVVAADALIAEPLGARWLPADRVIDGAVLAVVIAAGLAIGRLITALPSARAWAEVVGSLAAVAALAGLSVVGGSLALWPRASDWSTLTATERGLHLIDMWAKVAAAPPGRILFVRSGVPLVHGTEWYRPHTHVTAITPIVTGRAIVNGTFTHPSPIAALVYRGSAAPGPITQLVERLDGRSLFGRPLAELDTPTLNRYADRLGVSVIVALVDDVPDLAAVRDSTAFRRIDLPAPFVVFARRAAGRLPVQTAIGRWRLDTDGETDEWVATRFTYYPLWRAEQNGDAVAVRRGELGDLEVRPGRAGSPVTLVYRAGAPEIAGVVVSGVSLVVWAGIVDWRRRRARA